MAQKFAALKEKKERASRCSEVFADFSRMLTSEAVL